MGFSHLEQNVATVIESYEELLARDRFSASLAFHPKAERRFGTVIAPYHFLDPIPCGIDSCHTPHQKGYLITTSDGQETGIGGHCGRKHFGINFTIERKRIDAAVGRQRRIDTVKKAIADMPTYLAIIVELKAEYQALTELKRRLMDVAGHMVFTQLRFRSERNNPEITEVVPMTKEEARAYYATTNRKPSDRNEWPTKENLLATISGLEFIKVKFTDMIVTNLINPIEQLSVRKPSEVEAYSPRVLHEEAKWVGQLPNDIAKAREIIKAGHRFFTVDNLMKLVHLGADMDSFSPLLKDLREIEAKAASRK